MTPQPETPAYPEWIATESERRLHDDFRYFVWLIWRHLNLPEPTPRQRWIAHYLQFGPRRRIIQAFRGVGKSWLTAAYVLWRLYRNPQERILVVSANEDKALEFATFTRRLIEEVEQLRFLIPKAGRDSTLRFDVGPAMASQAPSVRAVGIGGQLTGGRATLIVSDDVEVPKNSYTETMRERLSELVKEYDAVLVPGGEVVVLGTPQTEQSIYKRLRERGYDCRIWPARFPTGEQRKKYGGALAPDITGELAHDPSLAGHSVEPSRFSDLDLAEREASYGASGFALQFMLDTSLSDALRYPLTLRDALVMDVDNDVAPIKLVWSSDPRLAWDAASIPNVGMDGDRCFRPLYASEVLEPIQTRVMVIDPSGRGSDETAYAVGYGHHGYVLAKSWGGFQSGYDDQTLRSLAEIARDHKVNVILVESNFGDGMFQKLLEPWLDRVGYPCTIEEYRAQGQKEARIIADLEPVLNQHRLILDAGALRKDVRGDHRYSLGYQMTHLTKDRNSLKHDDRVEVLSRVCRYFREQLATNTENADARHKQRLVEKAIDDLMREIGHGQVSNKNRYMKVSSLVD